MTTKIAERTFTTEIAKKRAEIAKKRAEIADLEAYIRVESMKEIIPTER